ncbi:MAG: YfcE family phosphodiesterase [Gemmataceae bacterium]|nr:YfcE family phosphodiesterase [Gemmataceae bacterium]MDW8265827.1 YfcE family phosphodiesterase [Gemmataceae bacterium]
MEIAILSDTHGRYATVEKALALLQTRKVHVVLHCGDIDDAETVWLFQGFTTHFVFGNCDTERLSLRQAIHGIGETLHEPYGQLELSGRRIAWVHGDDARLLRELETCGRFDYVFYGHTHQAEQHRRGPTLVANPGALHRAKVKTLALLDLDAGRLETVVVE